MIPPFPSHHIPCSQGGNWYPDDETVDPFILRSDQAWISSPKIHNYYIISHSQSWKVYEMSILFCRLSKCHDNWKLNALVDISQKSQKKRTQLHILWECQTTKLLKKMQKVAPGNIGSKPGQDWNSIITLTYSFISTKYVAWSPIGGNIWKSNTLGELQINEWI